MSLEALPSRSNVVEFADGLERNLRCAAARAGASSAADTSLGFIIQDVDERIWELSVAHSDSDDNNSRTYLELDTCEEALHKVVAINWMEAISDFAKFGSGQLKHSPGAERLSGRHADLVLAARNKLLVAPSNTHVKIGTSVSVSLERSDQQVIRITKGVAHFLKGSGFPPVGLVSQENSLEYSSDELINPVVPFEDVSPPYPITQGDLAAIWNMLQVVRVVQVGTRAFRGAPLNIDQGAVWPCHIGAFSAM